MPKLPVIALLLACAIFPGCRRSTETANVSPDSIAIAPVHRIMHRYASADSAQRQRLLAGNRPEIEAFMKLVADTPLTEERVSGWSWSLPVLKFTPDVDSIYPDTSAVARAVGTVLARTRNAGLELPRRRYASVVWGKPQSIIFVDSVMLIALNHYLGAEYEGYSHFPLYSRLVKEPAIMPFDIDEALIATAYPFAGPSDATALQHMLYQGALTAAKIEATGTGNPALALGYRPEQMAFLTDNEALLWSNMVERDLLYDKSASTIDRLIAPGPTTRLLDPRCPGRAGRYIGYRIVEAYRRNHPEATLPFLLSPEFYTSSTVLDEASYNPSPR